MEGKGRRESGEREDAEIEGAGRGSLQVRLPMGRTCISVT